MSAPKQRSALNAEYKGAHTQVRPYVLGFLALAGQRLSVKARSTSTHHRQVRDASANDLSVLHLHSSTCTVVTQRDCVPLRERDACSLFSAASWAR